MFGRTSDDASDLELPMPATFAGRFLLEDAVSTGQPTFVWRAQETAARRRVALTFFPAAWLEKPRGLASASEMVATLQTLSHPGVIVPAEVVPGRPWAAFVSPWVEGPTLHQMRAARPARRFEIDELRPWLRSLVCALETLHGRGFVHGALDPGLVIQSGAELCILNTGICAWLERAAGQPAGRRRRGVDWPYRSPSRRRGNAPGITDDIYALGAIVFEQLTGACPDPRRGWGRRPPRSGFIAHRRRRTGAPGGEVPLAWERAIWRCLDPRDRNRLGSVGELRVRLDLAGPDPAPSRVMPGARPAPSPASAPPAPQRVPVPASHDERVHVHGVWRLRLMVTVLALAATAAAAAFVWQLQQSVDDPDWPAPPAATTDPRR